MGTTNTAIQTWLTIVASSRFFWLAHSSGDPWLSVVVLCLFAAQAAIQAVKSLGLIICLHSDNKGCIIFRDLVPALMALLQKVRGRGFRRLPSVASLS